MRETTTVADEFRLDPVDFNVISQVIMSIPKEMSANLFRVAYSTIVREAKDASVVLMDAAGQIVAQSDNMPFHMNSVGEAFKGCAAKHDMATLEPDEVVVHNDPYAGGQHLPDVFLFTPVRADGHLLGFCCTVAHHLDVGGGGPGSLNPLATDIFGEGIVLSAVRVRVPGDFGIGTLGEIIASNVRVPDKTLGDFNAQLTANRTGTRRMQDLVRKYGFAKVKAVMGEMITYSERRTRAEIAKLPSGVYSAEERVDDDGFSDRSYRVCVTVRLEAGEIYVDFAGTDGTARGIINAPRASTISAVYLILKNLLTGPDVPPNEGCNRPVHISIPHGCLLNPYYPAPVRARANVCQRVVDAIMRVFSQIDPERAVACCHNTIIAVNLSRLTPAGWSVFSEPLRGGYGASRDADGACQCGTPIDNCRSTAVEPTETDFGFFRLVRYELLTDSMGYGTHNGAPSAVREYEILEDGVIFTSFSDRHKTAPWGLFGGMAGRSNRFSVLRGGEEIVLKSKSSFELKSGDRLTIVIGGAGGYGDPKQRARELVERDLRQGRISQTVAAEIYGYRG